MNLKGKNLLIVAGIIGVVVGITLAIPSFLHGKDFLGVFAILLLMGGIILLAIAFGE